MNELCNMWSNIFYLFAKRYISYEISIICFKSSIRFVIVLSSFEYYLPDLTLELPYQSNCLVLQFYFKIPTSCLFSFRNDVMTFATITKRII